MPPIPRMRPRCSVFTGGFDFSAFGDSTFCPPTEPAKTSNSEPSTIVLHGIPCMRGIIQVSIRMKKLVRSSLFAKSSSHQQDLPATTLFCRCLSLGRFTEWQLLANRDYKLAIAHRFGHE